MKYLKGVLIICGCVVIGSIGDAWIDLPVPMSIYGMVVLFILLVTKVVRASDVEPVSSLFLRHLSLFLVPAGVALMDRFEQIGPIIWPFLVICFVSTLVTLMVTAKLVDVLGKDDSDV